MTQTRNEHNIMLRALPVVHRVVGTDQNQCWPGDPVHDDHCSLTDHRLARRAVAATAGLTWEFDGWHSVEEWFKAELWPDIAGE